MRLSLMGVAGTYASVCLRRSEALRWPEAVRRGFETNLKDNEDLIVREEVLSDDEWIVNPVLMKMILVELAGQIGKKLELII
ncbi:hypothetical protein E3N88_33096 [Mikania micrantha]|uniref:Uncharacterized protein n=1 Tax=Mikania micrantha TaxID=192012 RepID=A0A5N6MAY8_9ASTR|nr:hypothetical protein E3N88_33096 [Mikania micrantha]